MRRCLNTFHHPPSKTRTGPSLPPPVLASRQPSALQSPHAQSVKKSATTPERDILKLIAAADHRPQSATRRIGIHTSTAGGVETSAERAWRLGCNTLQIFSSSPRMWRPFDITPAQCEAMARLRASYDLKPLVIHANYLINVAGTNPEILEKSISAFRAELERAISLSAEYVVLHPGSFRGCSREEGIANACAAIVRATDGLQMADHNLTLLIENTAGAEFSLGSSFESVAELIAALAKHIPVASCIDTCHTHVKGYDIVSRVRLRGNHAAAGRHRRPRQRARLALQ